MSHSQTLAFHPFIIPDSPHRPGSRLPRSEADWTESIQEMLICKGSKRPGNRCNHLQTENSLTDAQASGFSGRLFLHVTGARGGGLLCSQVWAPPWPQSCCLLHLEGSGAEGMVLALAPFL